MLAQTVFIMPSQWIRMKKFIIIHHWAVVVSRGWAKASACRLQVTVLCGPLPYCVAPVFVQVVFPPLGLSPLSSFLVAWSARGNKQGPSVVFQAVDMPYPGSFHFSRIADYSVDFCGLPEPDVGPSILEEVINTIKVSP